MASIAFLEDVLLFVRGYTDTVIHDRDVQVFKITTNKGPEGYDSLEMTKDIVLQGRMFKILDGEGLIGGAILTLEGENCVRLNRLFIQPEKQGCGYGLKALALLEISHSKVLRWELDTPSWAMRNQIFYEKNDGVLKEVPR